MTGGFYINRNHLIYASFTKLKKSYTVNHMIWIFKILGHHSVSLSTSSHFFEYRLVC
jgi:hypothetical protein